jgi:hypothetical protein
MLEGVDQLGYLLKQTPHVETYERHHPAQVNTLDTNN